MSCSTRTARSRALKRSGCVHGEEDELISIKEIRKFYAQLPEPKEMVTIEHANHLFETKTTLVGDAIEDLLADFTVRT